MAQGSGGGVDGMVIFFFSLSSLSLSRLFK